MVIISETQQFKGGPGFYIGHTLQAQLTIQEANLTLSSLQFWLISALANIKRV